jgi:uncharacterized protein (DUF849 family)
MVSRDVAAHPAAHFLGRGPDVNEPDALDQPKLIINAAITGIVPTKDLCPELPVTPEQIAADVVAVHRAGAAIVHLHAREPDGSPSYDTGLYGDILARVRAACPEIITCVTCSGRLVQDVAVRAAALAVPDDVRPEMASLTLGSMNFPHHANVNSPDTILELARRMADRGIKPELEIFEPGMANLAQRLLDKGVIQAPLYANLILGSLGTIPANARDLAYLVSTLPEGTVWAAGGIGRYQLKVHGLAVAMGGHVRTGLEDNPYYIWRTRTPASNHQLVSRVRRLAQLMQRDLATPAQARAMLDLPPAKAPPPPLAVAGGRLAI